jgi:two-component system, cell cycle response regulator DivK
VVTSRPSDAVRHEREHTEPPLVLIVDDNEKNRRLARDVLRRAGFRTLEAPTGAEGIALADEQLPDVVLLDLRLPDMDGTDVARALRGTARTAQLPLVALSALRAEDTREWLLAAGFDGYLEKPVSVAELPDRVRGFCTRAAP